MTVYRYTLSRACLLLFALWVAPAAAAQSLQTLIDEKHLEIGSMLSPDTGIVPGQKVQLTLSVATDRWFSGGTRITAPEVPGLVILQTEQFASNATEVRDGTTWVIQRWTLAVFPQRAGEFSVGPIRLKLTVNGGDASDVSGTVFAPPVNFRATVPAILEAAPQWVAAPSFTAHQSFDRDLNGLQVGDAFEQEVVLAATDVLAMMLPAYTTPKQAGLAAYPSPALLDNRDNRGEASASSSITISYVVEAAGQYRLPSRDFYWWDTTTQQLQLVSLPETLIDVAGGAGTRGHTQSLLANITAKQVVASLLALALAVVALRLLWILRGQLPVERLSNTCSAAKTRLRALRQPALPKHLNPGSNDGD